MAPNKVLDSAISGTVKMAETISNTASRAANGALRVGKNTIDAGVNIAGKGANLASKTTSNAWNTTSAVTIHVMNEVSKKGAQVVDFSARAIDKTLTLTRKGASEAARYAAIGMEQTFVAGLVVYDNARKITATSAEITTDKVSRAWNASKAAAQDLSWEKVQVQTGKAIDNISARIAYESLKSARNDMKIEQFTEILLKQNGDEAFANLLNEDDLEFLADMYTSLLMNHEKYGSDITSKILQAAKLYPAFEEALSKGMCDLVEFAHLKDNYGRSADARRSYRTLSLMFEQAAENPAYLSKIDPEKLKRVHVAGKRMGYANESSEILLYARKASPSLMAAFCPQDIAGAVRTQKKELGVDELPDNFQPGKAKAVASTQDDEIDPTLGMYGPHSWF